MRVYKRVNGKLPDDDIDEIVRAGVADLRMEGMTPTEFEIALSRKVLAGEISKDDAMRIMIKESGVMNHG